MGASQPSPPLPPEGSLLLAQSSCQPRLLSERETVGAVCAATWLAAWDVAAVPQTAVLCLGLPSSAEGRVLPGLPGLRGSAPWVLEKAGDSALWPCTFWRPRQPGF